jgi:hypothetical protein
VRTLEWRDITFEHVNGAITGGVIRLRRERSKNKKGRVLVLGGDLVPLHRGLDRFGRRLEERERLRCDE